MLCVLACMQHRCQAIAIASVVRAGIYATAFCSMMHPVLQHALGTEVKEVKCMRAWASAHAACARERVSCRKSKSEQLTSARAGAQSVGKLGDEDFVAKHGHDNEMMELFETVKSIIQGAGACAARTCNTVQRLDERDGGQVCLKRLRAGSVDQAHQMCLKRLRGGSQAPATISPLPMLQATSNRGHVGAVEFMPPDADEHEQGDKQGDSRPLSAPPSSASAPAARRDLDRAQEEGRKDEDETVQNEGVDAEGVDAPALVHDLENLAQDFPGAAQYLMNELDARRSSPSLLPLVWCKLMACPDMRSALQEAWSTLCKSQETHHALLFCGSWY